MDMRAVGPTFLRDKQHMAIKLGLDGLFPAPEVVYAILAPQEGVKKRIVDLGEHLAKITETS